MAIVFPFGYCQKFIETNVPVTCKEKIWNCEMAPAGTGNRCHLDYTSSV